MKIDTKTKNTALKVLKSIENMCKSPCSTCEATFINNHLKQIKKILKTITKES